MKCQIEDELPSTRGAWREEEEEEENPKDETPTTTKQ